MKFPGIQRVGSGHHAGSPSVRPAQPGIERSRHKRKVMPGYLRPLLGLVTITSIVAIVAVAFTMFRGGFVSNVPVTVLSPRAGLVMNPDAKVKMLGVQVGKVASIEDRPDGQAELHLALDPAQLHVIPANVLIDITSTTVFGAKYIELVPPAQPSSRTIQAGQVLDSEHVTVEINTVFQTLSSVLARIQPEKLNETLGALASALNGRGQRIGQMLSDLDSLLAQLDPSLPTLSHDIEAAPQMLRAYADAASDLMNTAKNATRLSQTVIDEQHNIDALLLSAMGLADVGNDVLGTNRGPLTDVVHLLAPTTDLTNRYNPALTCALQGMMPFAKMPPSPVPGQIVSASILLGSERYRYPSNLPTVAAKGGPQCMDLPNVPFEKNEPFLVTNVGANPAEYGNQGIVLNSDGLKQLLYGPIDGPPRNTAQIGQPG